MICCRVMGKSLRCVSGAVCAQVGFPSGACRWVDIPFTREESLQTEKSFKITCESSTADFTVHITVHVAEHTVLQCCSAYTYVYMQDRSVIFYGEHFLIYE